MRCRCMRTKRILLEGAVYHVTARANHKERLLESGRARDLFIDTMSKMRVKEDCRIIDFVVMENHVHLIIQPQGESSLSSCMKWLLGVYTMRYNREFQAWGTVWGGRYFSRPLIGIGGLITAISYVDGNPVRASLVERPEDWQWGGLYLRRAGREDVMGPAPDWLPLVAPEHIQNARAGV